ncbi:hypothetical protein H0H87_007659 [Tephrocybe sp. NHM501043]|nr:hypothetical protein H0H87_007659 [Tephrocybe sp. NHM501043]
MALRLSELSEDGIEHSSLPSVPRRPSAVSSRHRRGHKYIYTFVDHVKYVPEALPVTGSCKCSVPVIALAILATKIDKMPSDRKSAAPSGSELSPKVHPATSFSTTMSTKGDVERASTTGQTSFWSYLNSDLALALARLFEGPQGFRDTRFHRADQQALCSLISFNLGASVGRLGDRVGPLKRSWLVAGTVIQALLTMAAALTIWKSGELSIADERADPSWNNVLSFVAIAFMSASLGVQGVLGKRLNTQFGTTIVLTTVWVELVSDPRLFKLRQKVVSRDHKLFAAVALFAGSFVGRALLGKIGSAGTLGIGVGFRLLIAMSWIFIGGKPAP